MWVLPVIPHFLSCGSQITAYDLLNSSPPPRTYFTLSMAAPRNELSEPKLSTSTRS